MMARKKKKLWVSIVAIATALGITITGFVVVPKMFKNKSKTDTDKNKVGVNSPDEAVQYRIDTINKVYNFVDEMNSSRMLTVDNKKLMFSFDEGMALYLYLNSNNLSKTNFYSLFGEDEVDYDTMLNSYESALLKLRIYFARTTQKSGVSTLINDQQSKEFFSKYEDLYVQYNSAEPTKGRVSMASEIIDSYENDFINGSSLPYESVEPGVTRLVLASMETGSQIGWRNSTVKFPKDTRSILNDIEKLTSCSNSNKNVKNLIDNLNLIQATDMALGKGNNESIGASYKNLVSSNIELLSKNDHYTLNYKPIDANDPDIFNNYNGIQKFVNAKAGVRTYSSKVSTKSGKVVGNKKITASGKNLTEKELDKVIKSLPENLQKQAKVEKKEIQDEIAKKNAEGTEYGAGLFKGHEDEYDASFARAFVGKAKPAYITSADLPAFARGKSASYQKGYVDGYNKAVDQGYTDGSVAARQRAEKNKEPNVIFTPIEGQSTITTTPTVPSSSSTPVFTPAQPSTTTVPSGDSSIEINDEYKGKIDGPIYDSHGNIIPTSSTVNKINELYAMKSVLLQVSSMQDGYSKKLS